MTTTPNSVVIVLDIGCLCCGAPTELIGTYPDAEAARAAHPTMKFASEMEENDWRYSIPPIGFKVPRP